MRTEVFQKAGKGWSRKTTGWTPRDLRGAVLSFAMFLSWESQRAPVVLRNSRWKEVVWQFLAEVQGLRDVLKQVDQEMGSESKAQRSPNLSRRYSFDNILRSDKFKATGCSVESRVKG